MIPDFDINELTQCIEQVLDTGPDSQWTRLAEMLSVSADARRYYARYMQVRAVLVQNGVAAISRPSTKAYAADVQPEIDLYETMIMPGIADVAPEPSAPQGEIFQPAPAVTAPSRVGAPYKPFIKRLVAIVAVALTSVLAAGVLWKWQPAQPVPVARSVAARAPARPGSSTIVSIQPAVARITRSIDVQWVKLPTDDLKANLPASTHLSLAAGYIELSFRKGAKAIVEAPAEFTLVSDNQLELVKGRLSAYVPEPAHGFVVKTPQATLTDLGTEFGIQSAPGGMAEFDVFKGSVKVAAGSGQQQSGEKLFFAGQAAQIVTGKIQIDPLGAVAQRYVRTLNTNQNRLDLVDLISGGDGTSRLVGVALSANTGEIGHLVPAGEVAGDGKYHRVTQVSVVDGCFVPQGSKGPEQIDSLGHVFAFPATIGHSFNHIWTGGKIPWPPGVEPVDTVVDGVEYAQDPHRLMIIHSDQGLTLDLAAIRRLHPGETLSRFNCIVANTYKNAVSRFNVYVIVDGVARFERQQLCSSDGKLNIDIPMQQSDRFLTLATTDGDMSVWGDWAIWCDPSFATVPK